MILLDVFLSFYLFVLILKLSPSYLLTALGVWLFEMQHNRSIFYVLPIWNFFAREISKHADLHSSVVKNIDISVNIDTEISERYQY